METLLVIPHLKKKETMNLMRVVLNSVHVSLSINST